MKKLLLVICISLFSVFMFSCGDSEYESVMGYIPSGAEMKVSFEKNEPDIPLCEIPVVVGKDTVISQVRIMSPFPGRFAVIYHHLHLLGNTDSVAVFMSRDKPGDRYTIWQAMKRQK